MPVRQAEAVWNGTLREGDGTMSFGSFNGAFSFGSRFEEAPGANPEQLLGAAHAGCFSMAFSGNLVRAGYTPEHIQTRAAVHIERVADGFKITRIELDTQASVPGISDREFQELAEKTKNTCPVSQALASVEMSVTARLV
jgi:osmotically inducible protein OsmC